MKTDLPTAPAGSSQAPTAAVDKSQSASNTEFLTRPNVLLNQQHPHLKKIAAAQPDPVVCDAALFARQ